MRSGRPARSDDERSSRFTVTSSEALHVASPIDIGVGPGQTKKRLVSPINAKESTRQTLNQNISLLNNSDILLVDEIIRYTNEQHLPSGKHILEVNDADNKTLLKIKVSIDQNGQLQKIYKNKNEYDGPQFSVIGNIEKKDDFFILSDITHGKGGFGAVKLAQKYKHPEEGIFAVKIVLKETKNQSETNRLLIEEPGRDASGEKEKIVVELNFIKKSYDDKNVNIAIDNCINAITSPTPNKEAVTNVLSTLNKQIKIAAEAKNISAFYSIVHLNTIEQHISNVNTAMKRKDVLDLFSTLCIACKKHNDKKRAELAYNYFEKACAISITNPSRDKILATMAEELKQKIIPNSKVGVGLFDSSNPKLAILINVIIQTYDQNSSPVIRPQAPI